MIKAVILSTFGALLFASPANAGPNENKQLVANFIHDVFVQKSPDAARKYLAPDYVQHNRHVASGANGFIASMREWLSHAPSDMSDETLHLVADGDLVVAHQRISYTAKDGTKKQVEGFDLFRVNNGRIVEHWDADD